MSMTKDLSVLRIAKLGRLVLLAFVAFGGIEAKADAALPKDYLLTRLSLTLRGTMPTPEERAALRNGGKSLTEIAKSWNKNPRFITNFANYWLEVLQIKTPLHIMAVRDTTLERPDTLANLLAIHGLKKYYITDGGECTDPNSQAKVRLYTFNLLNSDTNQWQYNVGGCTCDNASYIAPFWDPDGKVAVCADARSNDYCGPDLGQCYPLRPSYPANSYEHDIDWFLTYEPGLEIAKTVADDMSYDEIVRGTKGLGNGAYLDFIKRFSSPHLANVIPAGSYPTSKTDAVFSKTKPNDPGLYWVDRGKFHAGILTTMAFQDNTDGWRGKFHRVMSALLCREFSEPADWKQAVTEESDLQKRPLCKNCHATLDRGARFFGRWPDVGSTDFYYNAGVGVSAIGTLDGKEDSDTVGFGRILSNTHDFYSCAVRHAFHFLVGRDMTTREQATMLEPLTAAFVANGKKLWPVMLKIIDSPSYIGGK